MSGSISTSNVWPNYSEVNVNKAENNKSNDTLGKDQFLSILVAQLRNQDPMQPMQDKEFIAQMAQFTSVEQLMNMSNELALLRQNIGTASSLIGKTITWSEVDSAGKTVYYDGVVDSIVSDKGTLYATVGDIAIDFDTIVSISEAKPGSGTGEGESAGEDSGDGTSGSDGNDANGSGEGA